jgi:hypothetical protein
MSQYRRLKDAEGAEASGHRDPEEIEAEMREREAALGPQASGVLGQGVCRHAGGWVDYQRQPGRRALGSRSG